MKDIEVHVPATTANLGPGFDCLGMALDLWNTTRFSFGGQGLKIKIFGEGAELLPDDPQNLIARAFFAWIEQRGIVPPLGVSIESRNEIPLGSGLGSSAAAVLSGLLAASCWLGEAIDPFEILEAAKDLEGHADNAAAALFGGLVVVLADQVPTRVIPIEVDQFQILFILPDSRLSTSEARSALPAQIPFEDAVFNLGRSALVVEALRRGDIELLKSGIQDKIHQPYRLNLIPGAQEALKTAWDLDSPAALSGAGPGLVAFVRENSDQVQQAMQAAFLRAGRNTRIWQLSNSGQGAWVKQGDFYWTNPKPSGKISGRNR